jgi:ribosomal protein S18 acetylase RimI-like enzyme
LRWTSAEADPAALERTFRAVLDGNDVGVVATLIEVRDDGRLAGTIRSIGIEPAFRGQEYEIDLLVHATAFLKTAGVAGITYEAEVDDAALLVALKRVGYTPSI